MTLLFPFRNPMKLDIFIFGGISTNMCTQSGHASAFKSFTPFHSRNCLSIFPISCLLYFGAKQCGSYNSMLYVIKYVWNCYHLFDSFPFLYSSLKLHGTPRLSRGFIVYNKKYIIKCTPYLTLNALQVGRVHVYLKL